MSIDRRTVLQGLLAAVAPLALGRARASDPGGAGIGGRHRAAQPAVLPPGIRSRFVDGVNGLRMHVLEAGYETPGRPALLLIHGYPELAYSWRKVMGPLAAAGYHVFAPDVRGYGRTSPAPVNYTDDLRPFGTSTGSRTCWRWCRRWAIAPWRPSSDTIRARRSPAGARWRGPTSSAPSR